MRKCLSFICVILLASPLVMAQKKSGDIYGRVVDEEGNPLPGVTLTLTGQYISEMSTVTSREGRYRFVNLPPADDYDLTAKLQGFKTNQKTNITVKIDRKIEVNLTMEMGEIEEEVTVTAETQVVDKKTTKLSENVSSEQLQSLPSARDPWVIAQMAPGVIVDQENVGGSESGQQSEMLVRGGTGDETTYNMDGMNVSDPDAMGASPGYYDFDSFEQIEYTIGGANVTQQQAGINLNMVTKRGGNRVSLGGRLFWTEEGFQAKKEEFVEKTQKEDPAFQGVNKIEDIRDYGVNMGAPLIKDKLWAWGSFGVQNIKRVVVTGQRDRTLLTNMAFKLNAQIVPENRAEFFVHLGAKNKWGRAASRSFPGGYFQGEPRHFGNPMIKLQDEHMFGDNLFISAKYIWVETGFSLTPMDDRDFEKPAWYDETAEKWVGPDGPAGMYRAVYIRPTHQMKLQATYFNDELFGASHEILVGVEYSRRKAKSINERPGNCDIEWNLDWYTMDFDGDGYRDPAPNSYFKWWDIDRYTTEVGIVRHPQIYLRDTITFGNFNILLGGRYDIQQPVLGDTTASVVNENPVWDKIASPEVQEAIDSLIPSVTAEGMQALDFEDNPFQFSDFCPRIGITWDVFGDGKTIAKLSFNQYTSFMDVDWGENWYPRGLGGQVHFWWWDDGDYYATLDELYWMNLDKEPQYQPYRAFDDEGNFIGDLDDAYGYFYSGYDPNNPKELGEYRYTEYDPNNNAMRTSEIVATLEREVLPDLGVTINGTYRKYFNFSRDIDYFMKDGEPWIFQSQDWYEAEDLPSQVDTGGKVDWDGDTGEASEHKWYHRKEDYNGFNVGRSTDYEYREPHEGYYREYYGVDLIVRKRLSNRWMMNASFTYQYQIRHWDDEARFDKSNLWAVNDRVYNIWEYSPWMFKVSGLYRLPYGFNVSGFFHARQGWRITEGFDFIDRRPGYNWRDDEQFLYTKPYGQEALPVLYKLDLRVEKMVKMADVGKIYLMADLFNVLNETTVLDKHNKNWGEYYYYGKNHPNNYFAPSAYPGQIEEVLNPFVARFGIRFQF